MNNKVITINGKLKKIQAVDNKIILEYEYSDEKDMKSLPISIEDKDFKFVGKILENSDILYKILLFPKSKFPKEFLDLLSKLGNNVAIVDYRTGKKTYARKDEKQQRIIGLGNIWSRYPYLTAGDIIGVAILNDEILIDFEFGNKEDRKV